MRRSGCVAVILLLGLGVLPAKLSAQQPGGGTSGDRGALKTGLRPNYPNPFNPETWFPFDLGQDAFGNGNARVTIRILNVLQQLVAYPVALEYKSGSRPQVNNLDYEGPGSYTAYWDGKDRNGQPVASGLYYEQLIVNGRTVFVRKLLVTK